MGTPLYDADGKLVGYLFSPDDARRAEYDREFHEFQREAAEEAARGVVRKWDGTNGKTTAEVLARLREIDRQAGGGS